MSQAHCRGYLIELHNAWSLDYHKQKINIRILFALISCMHPYVTKLLRLTLITGIYSEDLYYPKKPEKPFLIHSNVKRV